MKIYATIGFLRFVVFTCFVTSLLTYALSQGSLPRSTSASGQYEVKPTSPSRTSAEIQELVNGAIRRSLRRSFPKPDPYGQGNAGTCTGWAVAYLKSYQEAKERRIAPQMMSPSFIYNQAKGIGETCQSGMYIGDALDFVARNGVAYLADFPYSESDCYTIPNADISASAKTNKIVEYATIPVSPNDEMLLLVKARLLANQPVLASIKMYQNFAEKYNDSSPYILEIEDQPVLNNDGTQGHHAVWLD
jgi:hypothetical protein